MDATNPSHSHHSSAREKIIEHLFVGDVLKRLWQRGVHDIEVLRSEVDSSGYDLVMEHGNVVRHIQLKASFAGAKTSRQNANSKLCHKPSGCVVWIVFNPKMLNLGPFYWFGGSPGEALPDIRELAKHTKGDSTGLKAERPNMRVIGRNKFEKIDALDNLLDLLFGLCR